jgi:hypothetical protein
MLDTVDGDQESKELVQIQEGTVKDCVVLLVEDIPIYRPFLPHMFSIVLFPVRLRFCKL